jgi:hypothetical protein
MVGARSLAMALNRLIDSEIDARNPRTAGREIPAGKLSRVQVLAFCLASLAIFLVAVWQLDPICRWLWPIPVIGFVVYPYLKRVTWGAHLWLGAVDGLAPMGGWVAIRGDLPWQAWVLGLAVATWVAGFDLFYSLFDVEVDRAQGLHSWATRWGERGVFRRRARAASPDRVGARRCRGRARCRLALLDRRRGGRRAAVLRALARPAGRPATPRRRLLHDERRDQCHLLRIRPSPDVLVSVTLLSAVVQTGHGGATGDPPLREALVSGLRARKGQSRGLDLDVARGSFLLLTGPNGSGRRRCFG